MATREAGMSEPTEAGVEAKLRSIIGAAFPRGGRVNIDYLARAIAREGERKVCDRCMWSDPKYIAEHGPQVRR